MHCVNELCYVLIISINNFLIFVHFTNQLILKQSLTWKLNLIFKFSSMMRQIDVPRWAQMGHKGWRENGKSLIRSYTIALKFWHEFNANFVCYISQIIGQLKNFTALLQKCRETQEGIYLNQNLFSSKKNLALVPPPKKKLSIYFSVHSKLIQINHFLYTTRTDQKYTNGTIVWYYTNDTTKTWIRILHG